MHADSMVHFADAMRFTDTKSYFVSEASVYRLLKDHDLIASPATIVIGRRNRRPTACDFLAGIPHRY